MALTAIGEITSTHKSYGGVGRRRVVPELTGEFNITVPGEHHRQRRVFVANLQGTSCIAGSGQSLLTKER